MATDAKTNDVEYDGELSPQEEDNYVLDLLAAPPEPEDIFERPGQNGRVDKFIKESFLRKRLDESAGKANWQFETVIGNTFAKTTLQIDLPSGKSITRTGISGCFPPGTSPKDDTNAVKAAATDSFKRACKAFGAGVVPQDSRSHGGSTHRPQRDLGEPSRGSGPAPRQGQQQAPPQDRRNGDAPRSYGPPKTGSALFAWIKSQDGNPPWLLDWINNELKIENVDKRIVELNEVWVDWAYQSCQNELNRRKSAQESGY